MKYLLRFLFSIRIFSQRSRMYAPGFILPTTALLLLVVSLAVGSISLRTLSRTQQTVGDRQQQVIYNAATPVLDRAKAKIDHLLAGPDGHPLPSTGIPPEDTLLQMMLNEEGTSLHHDAVDSAGNEIADIYTFKELGETRIDIGGNDNPIKRKDDLDNAWEFKADTDGDGEEDAFVVYSILFNTPSDKDRLRDYNDNAIKDRAENLEVRHGPKSLVTASEQCPAIQQAGIEDGWFADEVNAVFLRKNFQVNAIVIPGILDDNGDLRPDPNATAVTMEFHQDRTFDRGNKWGLGSAMT